MDAEDKRRSCEAVDLAKGLISKERVETRQCLPPTAILVLRRFALAQSKLTAFSFSTSASGAMPPKRAPPSSPTKDSKKAKTSAPAAPRIGVDAAETPFAALQRTLVQAASHAPRAAPEHPVVVYWSR